ncbi:RNA polymerase sigma factor [Mucilaginibacter aquatilis]|uniref:Sigma-70 family RNA polymerase sigma factor n=1 Tax=Mucilaginibacter aquatilis TaxID=1517760 RepID=A0A6I4IQU1_9SPHI|nr:sigma-70 family RNA polymerase sigma factor [Mucilaginibacter aquatilis]MVN92293.1 sigma-70 family RNA polymerase sigma factor [Mucilaginibacter aquatilis]
MDVNNGKQQEWLKKLYLTAFPAVARYVSKQGGSLEEAKDIFQDALVIYYEKTVAGNAVVARNEKAYLLGISKYLWYHHSRKQQNIMSDDVLNYFDVADEEPLIPSAKRLLRYLEAAGKRCMDMLQAFYYDKQNMKEIAERFELAGERSATVQKHKCLEKVRNKVKEKALVYEDFCE